jgi:hypothetical protein
VNSVEAGALIAIAVVGWPLYELVTSGGMDATTAVVRGAIVVAACGYGVSLVVRLASRFEAEAEAERERKLNELYTDMEKAVADGTLTSDATPDDDAEHDAPTPAGSGAIADKGDRTST